MEEDSKLDTNREDEFRIAIVTNIIPHYREDFYQPISEFRKYRFSVYCQEEIRESALSNVSDNIPQQLTNVKYSGLAGDRFGFQCTQLYITFLGKAEK